MIAAGLILALPPKTHALVIDLPPPYYPQTYWEEDLPDVIHAITLDGAGQLAWNGQPVTQHELLRLLNDTWDQPETPGITFEPTADASYAEALATLNLIQGAGIASNHFCLKGIGQYHAYERREPTASPDGLTAEQACGPSLVWSRSWMF